MQSIQQACVLVGGRGSRLGELVRAVPKPLLDIGFGVTFLDFIIEELVRQDFRDILLLAGYLGDLVKKRYHKSSRLSAHIRVYIEPKARGTAGALISALPMLEPRFLMLNGDSFLETNLRSLTAEAVATRAGALIAVRRASDASRYGTVDLDGSKVLNFREKDNRGNESGLVSAGIYVLQREITNLVTDLPSSIELDVFPALAAAGELYCSVREGYFLDIGLPEALERGRRELLARRRRPAAFLCQNTLIKTANDTNQIEWIPGAVATVRRLNDLGFRTIVLTNQLDIDHHRLSSQKTRIPQWMQQRLSAEGAFIDSFYFLHNSEKLENYGKTREDPKLTSDLIRTAISELDIDVTRSFFIGLRGKDVDGAHACGISGMLFRSGNLASLLNICLSKLGDTQ